MKRFAIVTSLWPLAFGLSPSAFGDKPTFKDFVELPKQCHIGDPGQIAVADSGNVYCIDHDAYWSATGLYQFISSTGQIKELIKDVQLNEAVLVIDKLETVAGLTTRIQVSVPYQSYFEYINLNTVTSTLRTYTNIEKNYHLDGPGFFYDGTLVQLDSSQITPGGHGFGRRLVFMDPFSYQPVKVVELKFGTYGIGEGISSSLIGYGDKVAFKAQYCQRNQNNTCVVIYDLKSQKMTERDYAIPALKIFKSWAMIKNRIYILGVDSYWQNVIYEFNHYSDEVIRTWQFSDIKPFANDLVLTPTSLWPSNNELMLQWQQKVDHPYLMPIYLSKFER